MPIPLGVLDQIPVRSGQTAAESLAETMELAAAAERAGYHRYWLAEHHDSAALACSSPEVVIPLVAARTKRLRVGAGGIMLSHYSPLKVAECFRTLETLFPGRIDLGLGRAPGSDARTAAALAYGVRRGPELYPQQVHDLLTLLEGPLTDDHPFRGVRASPPAETRPEVWLLGSSTDSALLAASLGCAYSHAHFIEPRTTAEALALYRDRFEPGVLARPRASAGVSVLCADDDATARRLSLSRLLWWVKVLRGEPGPFPSVEEAEAFPFTGEELAMRDKMSGRSFVGVPDDVRSRLEAFAHEHRLDELVILTITHDPDARRHSYESLAAAFARPGRTCEPAPAAERAGRAALPNPR